MFNTHNTYNKFNTLFLKCEKYNLWKFYVICLDISEFILKMHEYFLEFSFNRLSNVSQTSPLLLATNASKLKY